MDETTERCVVGFSVATFIACLLVGSLYVWKNENNEPSTAPSVVKKRFISVFVASSIAPVIAYTFVHSSLLKDHSFLEILGIRLEGTLVATVVPLVLTAVLFLGPLTLQYCTGFWPVYKAPSYWLTAMRDLEKIGDYIVAPLTEEFVCRACILSVLIPCCSLTGAIFLCPLFFGAAHLHHVIEQIRLGVPPRRAWCNAGFQFTYTSLFGAYSAYLFLRTGHLIAPVVVHAFCNYMGFPDFGLVLKFQQPQRSLIMISFLVGLASWVYLLQPLTTPSLYANNLPLINA